MGRLMLASLVLLTGAYFGMAQSTTTPRPVVPVFQPTVPQANPFKLQPGMNNTPGSTVYLPPVILRNPRTIYIYNSNQGLFGQNTGNGTVLNAIMGGTGGTPPYLQNVYPNATNVNGNGAPWPFPANHMTPPQFPTMVNQAPVVGQSQGWFGDQKKQPEGQSTFGVQVVPGLPK